MPSALAAAPSLRLSSASPSSPDMIATSRRTAPGCASDGMRMWPPSRRVNPAGGQVGAAAAGAAGVPAAAADAWHRGCPVGLSDLRLLTVSYHDFGGRTRTGGLVVNRAAAAPLARVFR